MLRQFGSAAVEEEAAQHWSRRVTFATRAEAKVQPPEPSPRPRDTDANVTFNKAAKGWVGPITSKQPGSKWKRLKDKKVLQDFVLKRQKPKAFNLANCVTTKMLFGDKKGGDNSPAEGETDPSDSESDCEKEARPPLQLEELTGKPEIISPFKALRTNAVYASWRTPTVDTADRRQMLNWEKPSPVSASSIISPSQKLVRAERELENRQNQILFFKRELMKIHREYGTLCEELDGTTGKNQREVKVATQFYKQRIQQITRENLDLRGRLKAAGNSLLQQSSSRRLQKPSDADHYPASPHPSFAKDASPSTVVGVLSNQHLSGSTPSAKHPPAVSTMPLLTAILEVPPSSSPVRSSAPRAKTAKGSSRQSTSRSATAQSM